MTALDTNVLIDLLGDDARADEAEGCVRDALTQGSVVVCDVVLAELCSALKDGSEALAVLEEMSIRYLPTEAKSALRAGEMQRRQRQRGEPPRALHEFLVGAHALLQCDALITFDAGFHRDYFKGLKLVVPKD